MLVAGGVPPGTLRAGDRVEVFATYGGGRPHTEIVATDLEVVRILGEGAVDGGGIDGATTDDAGVALVLLVDADAAARLAYATTYASLMVAIIGPEAATGTPNTPALRRMAGHEGAASMARSATRKDLPCRSCRRSSSA